MSNSIQILTQLGFVRAGQWSLDDGALRYTLHSHADDARVLYAFMGPDGPLYVGKTTQPLRKRMYGYQNPGPTQRTNIRCNALLIDAAQTYGTIDIQILPDNENLQYQGVPVCLAAGLEDALISLLSPPWNRLGSKR